MSPLGATTGGLGSLLTMIMAGGQGERLYPLTRDRAKPAVPFGGHYRLIDVTLSNCLNSGVRRIHVLTQYKSDSLNRHIQLGWSLFNREVGEYIEVNPPQMRLTSHWYLGTADSIYQNIYTLERERPGHVLVLSGDHVYKMDYSPMLRQHVESGADLTMACVGMSLVEAARLGVLRMGDDLRVVGIQEKPPEPQPAPGSERAMCSMGVYAFKTEALVRAVVADAKEATMHDFGADVIPAMIARGDRVFGFRFVGLGHERKPYWRDIGTLDLYWQAHMDLLKEEPSVDLHDPQWPFRTYAQSAPPVKTICIDADGGQAHTQFCNSLVCNGAIVRATRVVRSVIGRNVRVDAGSSIEDSVIMAGTHVGKGVTVRKAIIDKHNHIPDGFAIGVDPEADMRHFAISEGGVVVVPKAMPLFRP